MSETLAGGSVEKFVWSTELNPSMPTLLEDGTNAYIYGTGIAPVAQYSLATKAMTYLVSTPAGVQTTVSSSGMVDYDTDYTTYGTAADSTGTDNTPFGFQGGYTDSSGLIYLDHRYYDPTTGQFISVDPLVQSTGQPYSYANDDPVNLADPTGMLIECTSMSGCGADSGDHAGPSGIGCSQNCGPAGPGLSHQSEGDQVFRQCAAAHSVQECEDFFGGSGNPPAVSPGPPTSPVLPAFGVEGTLRSMASGCMVVYSLGLCQAQDAGSLPPPPYQAKAPPQEDEFSGRFQMPESPAKDVPSQRETGVNPDQSEERPIDLGADGAAEGAEGGEVVRIIVIILTF